MTRPQRFVQKSTNNAIITIEMERKKFRRKKREYKKVKLKKVKYKIKIYIK